MQEGRRGHFNIWKLAAKKNAFTAKAPGALRNSETEYKGHGGYFNIQLEFSNFVRGKDFEFGVSRCAVPLVITYS
jgi:hypothetical protein